MQKAQIVAHFLVPADQHAPKTVHPTMRALHHPSAGFNQLPASAPWASSPRARIWAVKPNSVQQVPHLVIVIAFVQTHPLRACLASASGRSTAMLSMVSRAILKSLRLAPSTARPMGTPRPSVRRLRLVPLLPRSVGFLPTFFPPEGGFGHRAVHREPCPVNTLQGVVCHKALFPQGHEDVRLHPLLEAAVGGTAGTDAGRIQRIPLAARAEHEEDGIHGLAIIDAGPMAPQGMRFAGGKSGWIRSHNSSGIRQSRRTVSGSVLMRQPSV